MGNIAAWYFYLVTGFMLVLIISLLFKNFELERQVGVYKDAWVDSRDRLREAEGWWKHHKRKSHDARQAVWLLRSERHHLQEAYALVDWAEQRLVATEAATADIVTAVRPLLEQTDWTTGRWGGQLPALQAKEKERNAQVVALRQRVSALPAVAEMDPFKVLEGAAPEAWNALVNESGVPEDQTLHFTREGGVQRVSRPTEENE